MYIKGGNPGAYMKKIEVILRYYLGEIDLGVLDDVDENGVSMSTFSRNG